MRVAAGSRSEPAAATAAPTDALKISVVSAVFNPGRHLETLAESLRRQTMPQADFEVIFVDDGSEDGSELRLDLLAAERPNVRVIHIPNSGWPGRPRNLGIDAARGRYVVIIDHDDWLDDETLERLYDAAERHGSDVIAMKEVGHGFGVPRRMFRRTITDARLGRDDLLALLTPHKLFRRSMLLEHGVRFPEGRVRLEDHHFVVHAYFHARRIAVLADHPYYHWAKRHDGGNATSIPFDPAGYYANLREILDIVDDHSEPGQFRDELYAHWLRFKLVHKLLRPTFQRPRANARLLYREIRKVLIERFDARIDRYLPFGYRLVASAARADRFDVVTNVARLANGMRLDLELREVTEEAGRLRLRLASTIRDENGDILSLKRSGDRTWWEPSSHLLDGFRVDPEQLAYVPAATGNELALVVRERRSRVDYDDPLPLPVEEQGTEALVRGELTALLDPMTFGAGEALAPGTWDVLAQAEFGGLRSLQHVPLEGAMATRHPRGAQSGVLSIRVAAPRRTRHGPLAGRVSVVRGPGGMRRLRAMASRLLPPVVRPIARRMARWFSV